MHYSGSKDKIAYSILYQILKNRNGRPYVEPFMGGANVMCKVPASGGDRYGNDCNHYLIEMWKALQRGWIPTLFVEREEYESIKRDKDKYNPAIVAYVGFVCSFNGFWFSGYKGLVTRVRKDYLGNTIVENQQEYSRNHLMKQVPSMIGVKLTSTSYKDIYIPDNSIVYCDPPYAGVAQPYMNSEFDSTEFWEWARQIANKHTVFITEYEAPNDFVPIWEENMVGPRHTMYGNMHPNRLFVHESQIHKIDTSIPPIKELTRP